MIIDSAVERYGMIDKGDRIVVGFSGGADSVCLLHCLWSAREKYGIVVMAAHVNHGLRTDTADRDEDFCRSFCERLGIPFFAMHADVHAFALKNGISDEMAGRSVRYSFFDELCKKHDINKIATAHHKNDLAETILMNFMRGAGINGLSGIPPMRKNIIRPLIDTQRSEVEEYCRENGLEYVTDETNLENVYRRNKIRNELIPYIQKEFNNAFVGNVAENAKNIAADNELIEAIVDSEFEKRVQKEKNGYSVAIADIPEAVRRRLFIRMAELSGARDISGVHIRSVDMLWHRNETGKSCNLTCGVTAKTAYGRLYIGRKSDNTAYFEYDITIGERTVIPEAGIAVLVEQDESGTFAFEGRLAVRSRCAGDIFYPVGMKGRKKVKDYFVDEKIPADERATVPLLVCDGEIAMIIGKRRDRRFVGKGYSVKTEKLI